MMTRRQMLVGLAAANVTALASGSGQISARQAGAEVEILSEPHTLSAESRQGFELLFQQLSAAAAAPVRLPRPLIVAAGFTQLSISRANDLRRRVNAGATLLFENGHAFSRAGHARFQDEVLARAFGLRVLSGCEFASSCRYVRYRAPLQTRIRVFGVPLPVDGRDEESLAEHGGRTVCLRRALEKGQIIFLGSMLGPSLYAEDREALALGAALFGLPGRGFRT